MRNNDVNIWIIPNQVDKNFYERTHSRMVQIEYKYTRKEKDKDNGKKNMMKVRENNIFSTVIRI